MSNRLQRIPFADLSWLVIGLLLFVIFANAALQFIGTLVFSLFLYYATRPCYRRLYSVIKNATLSALLSMAIITLPSVITALYAASIAYQELYYAVNTADSETLEPFLQPVVDQVPVESVEAIIIGIRSPYQAFSHGFEPSIISMYLDTILESASLVSSLAFNMFVSLIFTFYLLRDGSRFREFLFNAFDFHESVAERYLFAVDHSFHKIFFGNILNAVITGIIAAVAFHLFNFIGPTGINIPYPTLLGIISGISSLIPFIGMKLVYFPLTAYVVGLIWYTDAWGLVWFPILVFGLTWIFVDAIPDLFLRPYISGGDIHLGALMLAYIIGPLMLGWYGFFLGPMILATALHFVSIVVPEFLGSDNFHLDDFSS